jgi:hypothetical protein
MNGCKHKYKLKSRFFSLRLARNLPCKGEGGVNFQNILQFVKNEKEETVKMQGMEM